MKLGREVGASEQLISYVKDRPGHDLRYAIDASKINTSWVGSLLLLSKGLERTVTWYLENQTWLNNITSGEYATYTRKYL
jgi:dTDP-glucose 4,6-dehydratase